MARSIQCLIVENDPGDQQHLQLLIERCNVRPILIAAVCSNGLEAYEFLRTQSVDLIFLDMDMPVMDGRAFLSILNDRKEKPAVIIISVADHKGSAWDFRDFTHDFLQKPINQATFDKALEKLSRTFTQNTLTLELRPNALDKRKLTKAIDLDDLRYVDCKGNEKRLYCLSPQSPTGNIEVWFHYTLSLEAIYAQLPDEQFFMVNQSCIVNRNFVRGYQPTRETVLLENGKSMSVSRQRKKAFAEWLQ